MLAVFISFIKTYKMTVIYYLKDYLSNLSIGMCRQCNNMYLFFKCLICKKNKFSICLKTKKDNFYILTISLYFFRFMLFYIRFDYFHFYVQFVVLY